MVITRLGTNRSQINLVYAPPEIDIAPRIIDKTRWILLAPPLLAPLQEQLATGHRAANLSSSTWQAITNAPYLLEAHPIARHGNTTIYPFGHAASRVTLIRTEGAPLEPVRVGNTSLVLLDRPAAAFLTALIQRSPRNRHAAIIYLKSNGMPLSGLAMSLLYRAIPKHF